MEVDVAREPPKSVLGRTFALLDAFGPTDRILSLTELSERTKLPKSTLHRLAATLVDWGALVKTDVGYHLGMHLFELGGRVPLQRLLRDAALPYMEDLYEATHETVHLAVLDGFDVLYIDKISGHRMGQVPTQVGGRIPAYRTALGKVLMAYSSEDEVEKLILRNRLGRVTPYTIVSPKLLRDQLLEAANVEMAYDREESKIGLVCAASPVFDHKGKPVAAMSVSGISCRGQLDRIGRMVRGMTRQVTQALEWRPVLGHVG
jgi:DNA-binding IclR family transcriptional regulator